MAAEPERARFNWEAAFYHTSVLEAAAPPKRPPPTAETYARRALKRLVLLMTKAKSETVQVSAAKALIEHAYGRPATAARAGSGAEDWAEGDTLNIIWQDRETS